MYVINVDEKQSIHIEFHYLSTEIQLCIYYFDSCGIDYIPQEVLSKIKKTSIVRTQHM